MSDAASLEKRGESAPTFWRDQFADIDGYTRDDLVEAVNTLATALDIAAHDRDAMIKLGKLLEGRLSSQVAEIKRIANSFESVLHEPKLDLLTLAQRRKEVCALAHRGLMEWATAASVEPINWPELYNG